MSGTATPFRIVIPARLGSTRLPHKVIREIHGQPVIRYVWEAARAAGAEAVVVATDHASVAEIAGAFGATVCMTAATHESGTDRVAEVVATLGWPGETIVVNLQGDEPLMPVAAIRQAAQLLADDTEADIATLAHPIHDLADFANPNVVKVVTDLRGRALYFSRAPVPWPREGSTTGQPVLPGMLAQRHIGLYAYRVARLGAISQLPPADLERCEMLEQLRAMAHGYRIAVGVSATPPPRGIDTEADLAVLSDLLAAHPLARKG